MVSSATQRARPVFAVARRGTRLREQWLLVLRTQ
ncbi:hypothetical protein R2601_04413 [Salipiger bermudensis HTCC2601]|uniref:Uncharacterized protein n=1 Tax=Salipiger bermudensis (strain DSM 26914 / JCM 13377 / KCTC 12554 / HTCC2601) TaxID=314265 RepID=Q0FVW3_SALBH|nr:hypothetical protein R2601_04413 [Salipiger bermudensis HTCC2601]